MRAGGNPRGRCSLPLRGIACRRCSRQGSRIHCLVNRCLVNRWPGGKEVPADGEGHRAEADPCDEASEQRDDRNRIAGGAGRLLDREPHERITGCCGVGEGEGPESGRKGELAVDRDQPYLDQGHENRVPAERAAEAHLERGVALARRIGRPLLEIKGLAYWGVTASFRSSALAVERGRQAIELARRHGWSEEPLIAIAYPMLAGSLLWQGELDEAERWLMEGEYALQSEVEPTTGMLFHLVRGFLEIARGHLDVALTVLRAAARLPGRQLIAAHPLVMEARAFLLHVLVRRGETAQTDAALSETAETERDRPSTRTAVAALRLAQNNPRAATAALAPVFDGSAPGSHQVWLIAAFLLEASARDALGEREAAGRALERGLDLAASDGLLFPFLLHPVPELLERHARQRTAHPVLIRKIVRALGGRTPAAPAASPSAQAAPATGRAAQAAPAAGRPEHLPEPLSQAEARVLRFLQTSLSAPEIARELYVSVNTVRTHMRHLYDKLGAHRRLEALDRARALGLLAPVPQRA